MLFIIYANNYKSTLVDTDWKDVWFNVVKRNWTITYFASVLIFQ
jgi:hypothetical protein